MIAPRPAGAIQSESHAVQGFEPDRGIGLQDLPEPGDVDVHAPSDEIPGFAPHQAADEVALRGPAFALHQQLEDVALLSGEPLFASGLAFAAVLLIAGSTVYAKRDAGRFDPVQLTAFQVLLVLHGASEHRRQ